MKSDEDERTWWIFKLPESTCYVPADTEAGAIEVLRRNCYKHAPVDWWPVIGTRVASRRALTEEFLRKARERLAIVAP